MLHDYPDYFPLKESRIGNTSFKKIVKVLTTQDQKARKAVDYVSGRLMYDNFDLIRRILMRCDDADNLIIFSNSLEAYLKSAYEDHIFKCDGTNTEFAFASASCTSKVKCSTCTISQVAMEYLKRHTDPIHHRLLDECKEKLFLYQGHRIRVANQRVAIDNILKDLEDNQGYIVMDFKMKFEAMYYREKTTNFYGKKGSSWHGSMVYSRYTAEQITKHGETSQHPLQPHHIVYYDHISSGDSMQDNGAVASYFEATCIRLRKDFPHINEIYVQTDNARCYKAPELIFALQLIAHSHCLKILCYIHTGIQDGKGPIDGHFATAMKHVSRFCNMGNDVVTPVDLVKALRANGGLNNCTAEMVDINRVPIGKLYDLHKHQIRLLRSIKNHSEIRYQQEQNKVISFDYSTIGDGVEINLEATASAEEGEELDANEDEEENEEDIDQATDGDFIGDEKSDDEEEVLGGELELTDKGVVTGCAIFGGAPSRNVCRTLIINDAEADDDDTEDEDELKCHLCKRQFAHQSNKRQHVCKGVTGKKDLEHYALSYAYGRIDQHEFNIIMIRDKDSDKGKLGELLEAPTDLDLTAGWAHPPRHGKMYGRNYIEPFKEDIARMFNAGSDDKAFRMGPARMLEKLKQQYPERLDLPSETEIRQAITTLMAKQKKGQQTTLTTTRGIQMPYLATVIRIFNESNGTIKPAAAWTAFQQIHPPPVNNLEEQAKYPTAVKVKGKISALRTQARAANPDGN